MQLHPTQLTNNTQNSNIPNNNRSPRRPKEASHLNHGGGRDK